MTGVDMAQRIVGTAVHELLDHGFSLSVDLGGDDYEMDRTRDADAVLQALADDREARLVVVGNAGLMGWLHFFHSPKGFDVLSDYSMGLHEYLPETLALAETYAEGL